MGSENKMRSDTFKTQDSRDNRNRAGESSPVMISFSFIDEETKESSSEGRNECKDQERLKM